MAGILTAAVASTFSGVTADPYFEYTTLLLPGSGTNGAQNNTFLDGSTNNFTITRNGNTTQGTFSPFSQTGWGNYFSGTGVYITVPDSSAFTMGSGAWTMECWIYGAFASGTFRVCGQRNADTTQLNLSFEIVNGTLSIFVDDGTVRSVSGSITSNTWNHVAAVRNGNTLSLYINGASVGTPYTSLGTLIDASSPFAIGRQGNYTSDNYIGYISNFRLVKGQALYTGNFTPATSALTASTVGSTGAGVPTQTITGTVSLLTCQSNRFIDNGNGNSGSSFTITVNGSPSVVAFSPFNPTASWSAATYGGSGYFDGSGDYLTFTDSANNLDLGGVQASVDFWFYRTSAGTDFDVFLIKRGPGAGWSATDGIEYFVGINSNQVVIYYNTSGGFSPWSTGVTITPFQWNHLCVATNTSNNISVFLNGTTKATSTFSIAKPTTRTTVNIGVDSTTDANYFIGYMSGMRFLTGSNAFDPTASSITVPTAPPTAVTGTQLLLNYTNAGIYDATSKNDLETVGNAQISTAISAKWGSGSMYFDGNGDQLFAPSSVYYVLGTGDFTVELWAYSLDTGSSLRGIVDFRTAASGTNGILLRENSGGFVVATGSTTSLSTTTGRTANAWQHIALVRSSGTLSLYVGGSLQTSTAYSTNLTDNALRISGFVDTNASPYAYYGYMQDLRISKYARYTTNFTPPTAAFPTL